LRSIHDFQWQGITISAWIFRIARNSIIDYYRKMNNRKNDRSLEEIADFVVSKSIPVDIQLQAEEEEIELYSAISELNEEEQYLVYYKFFESMSNKEISDIMGMTETNIGTKLHRIRKKIAKIISKK
jgi:RNA polymerase sigma factor (sigma-70 family)